MTAWLTLTEAAQRIQGGAALASAERRIRRWVASGDLRPRAGHFAISEAWTASQGTAESDI
jgi:hypothetical protein